MSKLTIGAFAVGNVLQEGTGLTLTFSEATDKNGDTVVYTAKVYWQPIYCAPVLDGSNYIDIETTDEVNQSDDIILSPSGSGTLTASIDLSSAINSIILSDMRIWIIITATDGISDHPDDPPVLDSRNTQEYYLLRAQPPQISLSSIQWTGNKDETNGDEIQISGTVNDYGFTTPANINDLEAASPTTWQNWRSGLETALGSVDVTFSFKVAYSTDNETFSSPAVEGITTTKELINATPTTAAYSNNPDFTITFDIAGVNDDTSYFFKAYLINDDFSLGYDSEAVSILLGSNTPLLVIREAILQLNLNKDETAQTGALMVARSPVQDDEYNHHSIALYDLHTEAGESSYANTPSLGFMADDHSEIASIIATQGDTPGTNDSIILNINGNNINLADSSPLTTKGDLYVFSTENTKLPIGTNGYILSVDNTENTGLKWIASSPLTIKGDIFTYSTENTKLSVGIDGYVLSADNTETTGLKWINLSTLYLPLTGGTLTGNLNITTGLAEQGIRFGGTGNTSFIGRYSTYMSVFNHLNPSQELKIPDSGSATIGGNTIWTSGNLTPTNYLPLSGGTMTGTITRNISAGAYPYLLYGLMADNDYYCIRAGGNSNAGQLEIATANNGNEPIIVSQYTGIFSSLVRSAYLLNASGNTSFPGSITSGSDSHPIVADRLYRKDDSSAYNLQTYWTGAYWRMYGYISDTSHADTEVGLADSATYVNKPFFTQGGCENVSGQDMNAVRNTGFYMGSSMSNAPSGNWGYFLVFQHNASYCVEVWFPLNYTGIPYWRKMVGGSWGSWFNLTS